MGTQHCEASDRHALSSSSHPWQWGENNMAYIITQNTDMGDGSECLINPFLQFLFLFFMLIIISDFKPSFVSTFSLLTFFL